LRENVIKIVRGKLELHAGEVQTLYNGRTMDLSFAQNLTDDKHQPKQETDGGSPGRGRADGDKRGRWRDGLREPRSMPGRTARGLPRPGTDGKSRGRSWRRTAKSRPMPGSDGRSPGQNRRRPLILCRNLAMGLGLFSRKTGRKTVFAL